ncbi:MAG TPA: metallophosphoesterase family protein [Verrucomicrobiae bacterium]
MSSGFGAASQSSLTRGPYLQFSTTNSMHIVWRTEGPTLPVVRFGKRLDALTQRSSEVVTRASLGVDGQHIPSKWVALRTKQNLALPKLHSAPIGTFQYEVRLTGLEPNTRYYYVVMDGEHPLTKVDASFSVVTPPPRGAHQRIRFWAIGDSGTGRQAQIDVYNAMLATVKRENHAIDFWLHLGDMAYGRGRDVEFQSRFFESYAPTLRGSVCWPTMGNHEGSISRGATGIGPYYDAYVVPTRGEAGGLASGTEAYYSFDWGNIHFVCLDSHDLERKPTGGMAKWLKADLERTKADWVIAFWHHPPYTKGSHDSDKEKDLTEMREYIMPLIDSGGVDLVLTGHSHVYERSMLIDGAYATPSVSENVVLDDGDGDPEGDGAYRKSQGIHPHEGTVQIVAGHAGANLGRKGTIPFMRKTIVEHGSVLIDVYGDTLSATMVNANGTTRDAFQLVKRGNVDLAHIALPWQPPEWKKPEHARANPATPAVDHKVLIPKNAEWQFMAGEHPRGRDWTLPEFNVSAWKTGVATFGFGDGTVRTEIAAPRGRHASVYMRRQFTIDQADKVTELGLVIDYKDAFIAYINGREAARVNVGRSAGRNAQKIKAREENGYSYVGLSVANLRDGVNTLAIEAHTATESPLDFRIDASLLLED